MARIGFSKRKLRALIAVICAIASLIVYVADRHLNAISFDETQDFVRFIDVGQGECILIYSNGYSALIDTGLASSVNDVCETLSDCGIRKIDVMLITHLHDDHTGGISGILELFEVENLILPEISVSSEGLSSVQLAINEVTKSGGKTHSAVQGMNFAIGEFELTVLASYGKEESENDRSVITVAELDGKRFLFTGDAEKGVEKALLKENLDLKCDVFNAGHHGSSTSNCEELLRAVGPRYTAISVGEDNMYGHPHNEVLADFEYFNIEVFRTDRNGDITFYVDNGKIIPKTEF